MSHVKDLKTKASTLRELLERYASCDPDVKESYEWIKLLLDAIDSGKVSCHARFPFDWGFSEEKITCPLTLNYAALPPNLRTHLKRTGLINSETSPYGLTAPLSRGRDRRSVPPCD